MQAEESFTKEKEGREDATQAVVKLEGLINALQGDMADAKKASDQCALLSAAACLSTDSLPCQSHVASTAGLRRCICALHGSDWQDHPLEIRPWLLQRLSPALTSCYIHTSSAMYKLSGACSAPWATTHTV